MEFVQLPSMSQIKADPRLLPQKVRETLATYLDRRADAEAARKAEVDAEAAHAAAIEADKHRPIDADFEEVEAAKLALDRARLVLKRARQAAENAYGTHLAAVEAAKADAIGELLGKIGDERGAVERAVRGAQIAVAGVERLKATRDYLVKPAAKLTRGAMSDHERQTLLPLALPDGYGDLSKACNAIVEPPAGPTFPEQLAEARKRDAAAKPAKPAPAARAKQPTEPDAADAGQDAEREGVE